MNTDTLRRIFERSRFVDWNGLILLDESVQSHELYKKWWKLTRLTYLGVDSVIKDSNISELVTWLREFALTKYVIHAIFCYKKEEVFYRVLNGQSHSVISGVFIRGAGANSLELLKWMFNMFDISKMLRRTMINPIFSEAAENGRFGLLKLLNEKFIITREYATIYHNRIFRTAANNGHLEILKWLTRRFELTKKDATALQNDAFIAAAKHGYLEILIWLTDAFQLTKEDATAQKYKAISEAAERGHINVVKWIIKQFNL